MFSFDTPMTDPTFDLPGHVNATLATTPVTRDRTGEIEAFGGKKRRIIESTWEIMQGANHPDDKQFPDSRLEIGTVVIDLTTSHDKSRKCLTSDLRVSLEIPRDGSNFGSKLTTLGFGTRGESITVSSLACDRYSAKAIRAAHEHALRAVADSLTWTTEIGDRLAPGVTQYLRTRPVEHFTHSA